MLFVPAMRFSLSVVRCVSSAITVLRVLVIVQLLAALYHSLQWTSSNLFDTVSQID